MLHLTTLGVARATPHGLQSKRLALVAYLAIARPRGAQRRDTVLALLWPELDQARARSALRQAVHAIRKTTGRDVITSNGTELLELNPARVACDLWELERARESGNHARVLSLYAGDLLCGLHLSDAPAFEEWRSTECRALRADVLEMAWSAAESAVSAGRMREAARCCQRALAIGPHDEETLRRGMRLLAEAGEPGAALTEFARYAASLRHELDVEPGAATTALAARLREMPQVASDDSLALAPGTTATVATRPTTHERKRWRGIAAASFAFLVAAAVLSSAAVTTRDPRRVEVAVVANASGVFALDTLARDATIAARAAIAGLQNVALEASTQRFIPRAGTIVRGLLRRDGDTLELRAEIVNRNEGTVARTVIVRVARRDHAALASLFGDRVRASVATTLYPGWGNGLSQPGSFASYQRFVAGMLAIRREDHERAMQAFRQAFDGDSGFAAAGLMAAAELLQMKRFAAADSLARAIAARGVAARPVDASLLEWLEHSLRGDREGARAAMQRIVALEPEAQLAWLQLAIEHLETGRPRQALDALDRLAGSDDSDDGWAALWATRIEALHALASHDRELDVVRHGLQRHPNLRVLKVYELRALAALGRTSEVSALLRVLPANGEGGLSAASVRRQAALELAAHGHPAEARTILGGIPTGTEANRLVAARVHYLRGEYASALAIYDSVRVANPGCLDCIGVVGAAAARGGDRAVALRHAGALSAIVMDTRPYLFGRHLLWQARIANLLGKRDEASRLLIGAFASGLALETIMHADPDLAGMRPDSLYRVFARVATND